jgi:hypothetical protein
MIKTRWELGLVGAVMLGMTFLFGLSVGAHMLGLARVVIGERESAPTWAHRIALVDEALEQSNLGRAMHEWREAHRAALRSGRSDGLIAVGDRALRIAESGGGSVDFRAQAREVYVYAALRASAERSPDTILRIAERLTRLGDPERAERVRRLMGRV